MSGYGAVLACRAGLLGRGAVGRYGPLPRSARSGGILGVPEA
ncbi:hypothetical protein [Azotobacter salinestris]|nr:hypothetical protein [Azotobacter salinestris]